MADCVGNTTSHRGLVWAITGVSVNTDYICRYQTNEMKCNYIMLGKFKGLLFLLGQIATSQHRRVTSEVKSKLPVLCFCASNYNTRTLSAEVAGVVGSHLRLCTVPLHEAPSKWWPSMAQPGILHLSSVTGGEADHPLGGRSGLTWLPTCF